MKNDMDNIDDLDLYSDKQFTLKDDKWTDCTNIDYSNRRKNEFKVYSNYYLSIILHFFPSKYIDGIQYYHVIEEEMVTEKEAIYAHMTMKQIEEKYKLTEKLMKDT